MTRPSPLQWWVLGISYSLFAATWIPNIVLWIAT